MEDQLKTLLEKAKTNQSILKHLKCAAIDAQDYELVGKLKDLENELFPDSEEKKAAHKEASKLDLLFRMVGIHSNESSCWLAAETLKLHIKKKGKFDLNDAARLQARQKEFFGE